MEQNMFCYQCQETAGCSGCTKSGVCGKRPETAALQDLLIWMSYNLFGILVFAAAAAVGVVFGRRYIKARKTGKKAQKKEEGAEE